MWHKSIIAQSSKLIFVKYKLMYKLVKSPNICLLFEFWTIVYSYFLIRKSLLSSYKLKLIINMKYNFVTFMSSFFLFIIFISSFYPSFLLCNYLLNLNCILLSCKKFFFYEIMFFVILLVGICNLNFFLNSILLKMYSFKCHKFSKRVLVAIFGNKKMWWFL